MAADGTVVELNESGQEILKLSGNLHGRRYQEAFETIPEFRDSIGEVLSERKPVGRREIRWVSAGESRSFGVTVTPAEGADGRFLGVLALFTDLTEMRKLEARMALTRHLSELGQVSAGAAHEFRNAAAAIDGFADLALRSPGRAAGVGGEPDLRSVRQARRERGPARFPGGLRFRPAGLRQKRARP